MNEKSKTSFQIEFAYMVGTLASQLGLNPTVGQIYGLLYMSSEPVSLNEMVKQLGISKGAASTNVRILESWGAVKQVWVRGTRKDYYIAEQDFINIFYIRVKSRFEKLLTALNTNISEIKDKKYLNSGHNARIAQIEGIRIIFNDILRKMPDKFTQKQFNKFLPLLSSLKKFL